MKTHVLKPTHRRERGMALASALMISVGTAMLLAAAMTLMLGSTNLGFVQVEQEQALQLADAGVNSELQYIALNQSDSAITSRSSQPVATAGVTLEYPGTSTTILGRQGTVTGSSVGEFFVYSSNDSAGTTAWDGVTSPFYITSAGYVNGIWERVQVTTTSQDVFNIAGNIVQGSYTTNPSTTTLGGSVTGGSDLNVTGGIIINGTVNTSVSGSTVSSDTITNANGCTNTSGQYTSSSVASGGTLTSLTAPVVYPTCAQIIRDISGHSSYTDAQAWTWRSNNNCNGGPNTETAGGLSGAAISGGGVYTYTTSAKSSTINTTNCVACAGKGNGSKSTASIFGSLCNGIVSCTTTSGVATGATNTDTNCWQLANNKPGTSNKVQTLIFEPGDYYFTNIHLGYSASTQIVIDTQASASGGTPGQVRFWVYNSGTSTTNDYVEFPLVYTTASGTTTPDSGYFRVYYGTDGKEIGFARPSGCSDYTGATISGPFTYYCGIYAISKLPDEAATASGACTPVTDNVALVGGLVHLTGQVAQAAKALEAQTGCQIEGTVTCDKLKSEGVNIVQLNQTGFHGLDHCVGGTISGYTKD